ncbi:MAG: ABC transporter permease, partial [Planctomycetota bacterium]
MNAPPVSNGWRWPFSGVQWLVAWAVLLHAVMERFLPDASLVTWIVLPAVVGALLRTSVARAPAASPAHLVPLLGAAALATAVFVLRGVHAALAGEAAGLWLPPWILLILLLLADLPALRRILRLFGVEWMKTRRSLLFKSGLLATAAVTLLGAATYDPLPGSTGWTLVSHSLGAGMWGAEVFLLVLGAISLSGEATGGTLKMMLPHAYRRSDWILAKGLVLLLVAVLFAAVVVVAGVLHAQFTQGLGDVTRELEPMFGEERGTVELFQTGAVMQAHFMEAVVSGLAALAATALLGVLLSSLFDAVVASLCTAFLLFAGLKFADVLLRSSAAPSTNGGTKPCCRRACVSPSSPESALCCWPSGPSPGGTSTLDPRPRRRRTIPGMACRRLPVIVLGLLLATAAPAAALETGKFKYEPGGKVSEVRTADVNGDGRLDLVLLLTRTGEDGLAHRELLVLRTPSSPARGSFFTDDDVTRIPLDTPALASAGAVSVGRFGRNGETHLRFFGPERIVDVRPTGEEVPPELRLETPTLFARSAGRPIVFWDGSGDLDGDGRDESWFPAADGNGRMRVLGGDPEGDRTLALECVNRGSSDEEHLLIREASVPVLLPADLDGDGRRELMAYRDGTLLAWAAAAAGEASPLPASLVLPLGFEKEDLEPEEVHTPRLQLADVDGDGKTDLLVTLVTGRRDQLGSLRTRLMHYPGPFVHPETGALTAPRVRIDTESIALHSRFVDVNGDGALDYVCSSIRGAEVDLIRRILGQAPTIWHVTFLFDRQAGTFETVPYFSTERPYSREEAMSNRFGASGYFEGD